jgi:hypothetical protein
LKTETMAAHVATATEPQGSIGVVGTAQSRLHRAMSAHAQPSSLACYLQ